MLPVWGAADLAGIVPYTFEAIGWEDFEGDRHEGTPSDLQDTHGVFVHASDPENPEDQHYFWAFTIERFEDWAEWWVYIGSLMDMYGMDLAA